MRTVSRYTLANGHVVFHCQEGHAREMLQYTIRRLLLIIPTMFFVALITFALAHAAPGSPFEKNVNRPLPQATIDRLNRLYNIDKPVPEQFVLFLGNAIRLDFGPSLVYDRQVIDIIGQGFPVSAQLGVQALLLSLAISLPLGVVSALKQNTAGRLRQPVLRHGRLHDPVVRHRDLRDLHLRREPTAAPHRRLG